MTIYDLISQVITTAFNIVLPFGFTFGIFILFIWSFPMVIKFIKSIF